MTAPGGGKETITVCIEDYARGISNSSPDTHDSHPQSWAQRKAALTALMGTNDPAVTAVLSSPANLPVVRDLLRFPELKIDGADEALKQKGEIAELFKTALSQMCKRSSR